MKSKNLLVNYWCLWARGNTIHNNNWLTDCCFVPLLHYISMKVLSHQESSIIVNRVDWVEGVSFLSYEFSSDRSETSSTQSNPDQSMIKFYYTSVHALSWAWGGWLGIYFMLPKQVCDGQIKVTKRLITPWLQCFKSNQLLINNYFNVKKWLSNCCSMLWNELDESPNLYLIPNIASASKHEWIKIKIKNTRSKVVVNAFHNNKSSLLCTLVLFLVVYLHFWCLADNTFSDSHYCKKVVEQ